MRSSLIAGGSALLLALSLAACGGGGDTGNNQGTGEPQAEPEVVEYSHDAALTPDDINPGWVLDSENNVGGTSDVWYPVTDDANAEGLFFSNAANEAGLDVTFVNNDGNQDSVWDLEVVNDHLKTKADATDKRQVDITFQDDFTCYDAVSDTTYIRGIASIEDMESLFANHVFVYDPEDPERHMIDFGEGGEFELISGGESVPGTWQVKAVYVVEMHFESDTSSWDDEMRVILDEEGEPIELDDGSSTNMVLYEK